MSDVFLKAISAVRQAKEDQKKKEWTLIVIVGVLRACIVLTRAESSGPSTAIIQQARLVT